MLPALSGDCLGDYFFGMLFWIVTVALALAIALPLALALVQGPRAARSRADYDIAVYRHQLESVEADLARGVITPDAADRTRAEIARRILAADRGASDGSDGEAPVWLSRLTALVLAVGLVGGSVWAYGQMGAPGYGDLPRAARLAEAEQRKADRPDQAAAEMEAEPFLPPAPDVPADHLALVEQLRAAVAEREPDEQGLSLLARNEAALGNFQAAYAAQEQLIALRGAQAVAEDYAILADMMIIAAGGYVSPEAEAALGKALARDPGNGTARYYTGLLHAQTDRPDKALDEWQSLLETSPSSAPWVPAILSQIENVAVRAGERFTMPSPGGGLPGPSADDIAAAEGLAPAEQQAMIRGMVEGLAERLALEGGSAEEWARLIAAFGVLGETDRARAIWYESQLAFAGQLDALAELEAAAARAGLLQ